jgi:predicted DNA repair protein MutK
MSGKNRCLDPSHPTLLSPLLLILSAIYLSYEAPEQKVGIAVRTALRAHTQVHIKTEY